MRTSRRIYGNLALTERTFLGCLSRRLLLVGKFFSQTVDCLHQTENHECRDKEIENCGDKVAVTQYGGILTYAELHFQVGEIRSAENSENGGQYILIQRCNNGCKSAAHNHTDCHIHHIAAHNKFLEFVNNFFPFIHRIVPLLFICVCLFIVPQAPRNLNSTFLNFAKNAVHFGFAIYLCFSYNKAKRKVAVMQRINEDIREGNFKQVYLLYGEERYLKKQYTDRLQKALCAEGDDMNTHFYEGKDVPVGEIIDLAETLPFLSPRRVIFISNSGLFKSGGEKMAEYLASPNETTFFVFTESEVDKRSKLFKAVQSKGYAAEFAIQDENTLKRWVAGILNKEGKKIKEGTVQLFLSKTGTDMENIHMELEKLICYCMDQDVITDEDVNTICTNRISNHIFDMINAIADKQTAKALQLYYDLLALKEPPMRILFLIARQYNLLLQTKELKSKGYDNRTIATKIGVPPFVAGKYVTQASRFKTADLRRSLTQCVESEEAVKTGRLNDMMSVEMLILQ